MNQSGMTQDSDFDTVSAIKQLPVSQIGEIAFGEMLDILTPYVLVQVPENWDPKNPEDKRRYDYLLARLANLYAYLRVLWCAITYERAVLKRSNAEKAEIIQKKKEALYELGNAVKLKYEAVSRKITVALSEDESLNDRVDYNSRREQVSNTPRTEPQRRNGWDHLK